MKILFLGLNYSPEEIGIGLYSGDMTAAWADAGHSVRAIVAVPYYPSWSVAEGYDNRRWTTTCENGVTVTRCPIYVPDEPSGLKRILLHLSFFISALVPMLRAARSADRPDLVFTVAPSLIAAPLAKIAARLAGAKSWLHVQDFEMEAAMATGLVGRKGLVARLGPWFERKVLGMFDTVSTISPQMVARLVEKGVAPEKTYEMRNWADVSAIRPYTAPSPFRARWGVTTPHVALYSGNIATKQGIDIVVDAARLLRHRKDLTFVVCGQGPSRAQLEAAAADLDNIRFYDLQPREELDALLGLASVHLMPQLAGAADLVLPSKLTNMLASGRPVVATADPGTGLASEVDGCGLLAPPGDASAFARAIERLIDDADLASALARSARSRAEERWSKEPILSRLGRRMEFGMA